MQTNISKIYKSKSILITDSKGHAVFFSQTLSSIVYNLKVLSASSSSQALYSFLGLK